MGYSELYSIARRIASSTGTLARGRPAPRRERHRRRGQVHGVDLPDSLPPAEDESDREGLSGALDPERGPVAGLLDADHGQCGERLGAGPGFLHGEADEVGAGE